MRKSRTLAMVGTIYIYICIYNVLGSFGKVCKIKRISDGKVMVWKELNYGRMGEKEKQ